MGGGSGEMRGEEEGGGWFVRGEGSGENPAMASGNPVRDAGNWGERERESAGGVQGGMKVRPAACV